MLNTFNDIIIHLNRLGLFHMKLGQDRMQIALEKLELLPLPYTAVQIVGTNGKGSTSTFLSYLAQSHHLNVGLFISPHFISPKERILFNNAYVSEAIWLKCAKKVYCANPDLTYFEFLTVLASLIYAELNADIVFFEAGLGGKFDATTSLQSAVTVFTPFSLDHCSILGNSLKEIAEDKAQAINSWTKYAITSQQEEQAKEEVSKVAKKFNIPLYHSEELTEKYYLALKGLHQQENANLALTAWRIICEKNLILQSDLEKEKFALENAFIAGRLQIIPSNLSPLNNTQIILDGGHNVQGLEVLKNSLNNLNIQIDYIIFSCLEDKDFPLMCDNISEIAQEYTEILIPTIQDNPRAFNSEKLIEVFSSNNKIHAYKNLDECLKSLHNRKNSENSNKNLKEKNLLICGSLYLLAEFYEFFPQYLTNK